MSKGLSTSYSVDTASIPADDFEDRENLYDLDVQSEASFSVESGRQRHLSNRTDSGSNSEDVQERNRLADDIETDSSSDLDDDSGHYDATTVHHLNEAGSPESLENVDTPAPRSCESSEGAMDSFYPSMRSPGGFDGASTPPPRGQYPFQQPSLFDFHESNTGMRRSSGWSQFANGASGFPGDGWNMPIRSPLNQNVNRTLPPHNSVVPGEGLPAAWNQRPSQVSISSSEDSTPMTQLKPRKRLLSSPIVAEQYRHPSKQQRLANSPIEPHHGAHNSGSSTRSSSVSVPDFLRDMLSPEEAKAQKREMRRLEQQREERLELERLDAAYARQLQAELDQANAGPSSSSSVNLTGGSQYQSVLNTSGNYYEAPLAASHRPVFSQPNERQPIPQVFSMPLSEPQHFATASIRSQPFVAHPNPHTHSSPTQQMTRRNGPHEAIDVSTYPMPHPSLESPHGSHHDLLTASGPSSMAERVNLANLPVVNLESSDSDDSELSILPLGGFGVGPPVLDLTRDEPYTSRYRPVYADARGQTWSTNLTQPGGLFSRASNAASSFLASLPFSSISGPFFNDHDHGWGNQRSMYDDWVDPKATAKEIRELMENIRPDEDLGSSDRTGSPEDMADGCALYEHQKLGLAWMIQMEEGSNKGGILADDMGLGKTIQAIALMVSRRSDDPRQKTNLVVAPLSLLRQWENEISLKVRPHKKLSVYTYHGSKKKCTFDSLKFHDVVLTTYGALASEYRTYERFQLERKNNPQLAEPHLPLLGARSKFYRVFLDEAQNIKNKNTKSFKAASLVQAKYRFCMTGTPMMNNVGELYSLISFLRIRPYCEWVTFKRDIEGPLNDSRSSSHANAMRRLQALIKALLLRRTKKSQINGKPILELPERTTVVEHAVMEGDQAEFYRALETQTQIRFNRYLQAGTVGRNYHNVLLLLLRLRQTCCHPHLIRNLAQDVAGTTQKTREELEEIARKFLADDAIKRLLEEGQLDCPICMDAVENSTIFTPCGHSTCSECFTRLADSTQQEEESPSGKFKCIYCRADVLSERVTDWNAFKSVHMPDVNQEDNRDESAKDDGDAQPDEENEEDGSDSDDDDSSDETSSLDSFIVNDEIPGAKQDKGKGKADLEQAEDVHGLLSQEMKKGKKKRKGKDKHKSTKGKGKNKVKGKGKGKEKLDIKLKNPTLSELQKQGNKNLKSRRQYFEKLRADFVTSAKIEKCLEIMDQIMTRSTAEKTIIFSQFTTFLDLLQVPLANRHWQYQRYDGSMNITERDNAVLDFTHRPSTRIMLVSLKAGNAGLNLTAANNVIMLDPFWNPYIEQQAIDRVHRIGQRLPVTCYRILIAGTVEDRIMNIQENKRRIVDGALDEGAASGIARLTQQDLTFLFGV